MSRTKKVEEPFHNATAEAAILGTVMLLKYPIDDVLRIIPEATYFYKEENVKIYKAMIAAKESGIPIDSAVVLAIVKKQALSDESISNTAEYVKGMVKYIGWLSKLGPSAEFVPHYADIVAKAWRCREIERNSLEVIAKAKLGDLSGALEQNEEVSMFRCFPNGVVHTWAELNFDNIEWVWENWLANGFLSMIVASSGIGKSSVVLRICESIITGKNFLDGTNVRMESRGKVLWCEAENGQFLNWMRGIKTLRLPSESFLTPTDPYGNIDLGNNIDRAAIEYLSFKEDVKLVVIDSLSSAQLSVDENKNTGKDGVMKGIHWVSNLAARCRKPFLLTHHPRKVQDGKPDIVTLDRVRGGGGIAQHCRVIFAVDRPNPLDESRILKNIKINIGPQPKSISLKITDTVERVDDISISEEYEIEEESISYLAKKHLIEILKDGPENQSEIKRRFDSLPIPWGDVESVSKKMKILKSKTSSGWVWALRNE